MTRRALIKGLIVLGLLPSFSSAKEKNSQVADDKKIKYVTIDDNKYILKPAIKLALMEDFNSFGHIELHVVSFFVPQINKKYIVELEYLGKKLQICGILTSYNLFSDYSTLLTFKNSLYI
jgi:hypothetical protein